MDGRLDSDLLSTSMLCGAYARESTLPTRTGLTMNKGLQIKSSGQLVTRKL